MSERRFSRQDLVDRLRKLAERLGRAPTERDTHVHSDVPSHTTYADRFGSWRAALQAAGIPLDPTNMGYNHEELLEHLRNLAESLGRTPSLRDLKGADGACGTTYKSHFGSWSAALAEAGLDTESPSRRYERDELLENLRALAKELGHAPTMAELWEREDLPSPSTYKYRFGSWSAALKEAGMAGHNRSKSAENAGGE